METGHSQAYRFGVRFSHLLLAATLGLPGCSTIGEQNNVSAPGAEEIRQYIVSHWQGWDGRFSAFFKGQEEAVTLLRVDDGACIRRGANLFLCRFNVKGQFASGREASQTMQTHFMRGETGGLLEVLVGD